MYFFKKTPKQKLTSNNESNYQETNLYVGGRFRNLFPNRIKETLKKKYKVWCKSLIGIFTTAEAREKSVILVCEYGV